MRRIPGFLVLSGVVAAIEAIANNWEAVKPRILAVWADLQRAAPTWLGGQGEGPSAFFQGEGLHQLRRSVERLVDEQADAFRSTEIGQGLIRRGVLMSNPELYFRRMMGFGELGFAVTPEEVATALRTVQTGTTVTTGPINVTVNVAPTNANPQTIGEAAAHAVGSQLRRLLADAPSLTE